MGSILKVIVGIFIAASFGIYTQWMYDFSFFESSTTALLCWILANQVWDFEEEVKDKKKGGKNKWIKNK